MTVLRIDTSGLDAKLASLARFSETLVAFLQVGAERFIFPKLKAIVPVRTGTLRDSRRFRPTPGGFQFYWTNDGFYWRFVGNLGAQSQRIVQDALPALFTWAVAQTRKKLGL